MIEFGGDFIVSVLQLGVQRAKGVTAQRQSVWALISRVMLVLSGPTQMSSPYANELGSLSAAT